MHLISIVFQFYYSSWPPDSLPSSCTVLFSLVSAFLNTFPGDVFIGGTLNNVDKVAVLTLKTQAYIFMYI